MLRSSQHPLTSSRDIPPLRTLDGCESPKSEQLSVSLSSCVLPATHQLLKGAFCSRYRSSRADRAFYRTIRIHLLLPQGVLLKRRFFCCFFWQADYNKLLTFLFFFPPFFFFFPLCTACHSPSTLMSRATLEARGDQMEFDLRRDNSGAQSGEDRRALAGGCCWMYGLWLAGCC